MNNINIAKTINMKITILASKKCLICSSVIIDSFTFLQNGHLISLFLLGKILP